MRIDGEEVSPAMIAKMSVEEAHECLNGVADSIAPEGGRLHFIRSSLEELVDCMADTAEGGGLSGESLIYLKECASRVASAVREQGVKSFNDGGVGSRIGFVVESVAAFLGERLPSAKPSIDLGILARDDASLKGKPSLGKPSQT